MKIRLLSLFLLLTLLFVSCARKTPENLGAPESSNNNETQGEVADLGGDDKTFGDSLDDLGIYDGYF